MIEFNKGKIEKLDKRILKSFNFLPADPYEKTKGYFFRFRKFSRILINNKKIVYLKDTNFFQNKKRNKYAGGQLRKFKSIDKSTLGKFIKIYQHYFSHFFSKQKNFEVGFHQIRIKCGKDFVGYPVPEGWHKDGFNFVVLLNFNSKNIKGGITRIKTDMNGNDTFSSFLKKGEYILLNDEKYFHYTDPINVTGKFALGTRDTLVITIKFL